MDDQESVRARVEAAGEQAVTFAGTLVRAMTLPQRLADAIGTDDEVVPYLVDLLGYGWSPQALDTLVAGALAMTADVSVPQVLESLTINGMTTQLSPRDYIDWVQRVFAGDVITFAKVSFEVIDGWRIGGPDGVEPVDRALDYLELQAGSGGSPAGNRERLVEISDRLKEGADQRCAAWVDTEFEDHPLVAGTALADVTPVMPLIAGGWSLADIHRVVAAAGEDRSRQSAALYNLGSLAYLGAEQVLAWMTVFDRDWAYGPDVLIEGQIEDVVRGWTLTGLPADAIRGCVLAGLSPAEAMAGIRDGSLTSDALRLLAALQ